MRILGLGLVLASLVLGAGGVGYTSESPTQPGQFGMTRIDVEGGSCEAPAPRARLKLPKVERHGRMLNLSNRGFNYRGVGQKPAAQAPASARD